MSGKSQEEIAFELVAKLKGMGVWGEKNMGNILDMYAECLDATKGKRAYIPGRCVMEPADQAKLDAVAQQRRQQMAAQSQAQVQQQRPPQQSGQQQSGQQQAQHPAPLQQVRPAG